MPLHLIDCDEWFWLKIKKGFKFGFENVLNRFVLKEKGNRKKREELALSIFGPKAQNLSPLLLLSGPSGSRGPVTSPHASTPSLSSSTDERALRP